MPEEEGASAPLAPSQRHHHPVSSTQDVILYTLLILTSPLWLLCHVASLVYELVLRPSGILVMEAAGRKAIQPDEAAPILITGTDGGYARELAHALVEEGWVVYAGCTTSQGFQSLRNGLSAGQRAEQDRAVPPPPPPPAPPAPTASPARPQQAVQPPPPPAAPSTPLLTSPSLRRRQPPGVNGGGDGGGSSSGPSTPLGSPPPSLRSSPTQSLRGGRGDDRNSLTPSLSAPQARIRRPRPAPPTPPVTTTTTSTEGGDDQQQQQEGGGGGGEKAQPPAVMLMNTIQEAGTTAAGEGAGGGEGQGAAAAAAAAASRDADEVVVVEQQGEKKDATTTTTAAAEAAAAPLPPTTKKAAGGGGKLIPIRLDTTSTITIKGAAARIASEYPDKGLFALIHAASSWSGTVGPVEWLQPKDVHKTVEVNFGGVAVTVAMLPLLRKRPGSRIINVTATLGMVPCPPFLAPLNATTYATQAFTASLRQELRPQGIHVCSVTTSLPSAVVVREAEESMHKAFQALDDRRKAYYGGSYPEDAAKVLRAMEASSSSSSSPDIVTTLREAVTSVTPSPEYLVGIEAKLGRTLFALLPPRVVDMVVSWRAGDNAIRPAMLPHAPPATTTTTAAAEDKVLGECNNHLLVNDETTASSSSSSLSQSTASHQHDREVDGSQQHHHHPKRSKSKEDDLLVNPIRQESDAMQECLERYEIKETIGTGGFSVVKLGLCRQTQQKVALKIIRKDIMRSAKALELLNIEMKVLDRLKPLVHPNIVNYMDRMEDPDGVIMIMEFCPGGDLFQHVSKGGVYSMREASTTIRQILTGLVAIHANGIIHRDVKPENCLYGCVGTGSQTMTLKLCDFGLALLMREDGAPVKCTLAGTPRYMAPEVLNTHAYTEKCDVWAAGVILYALLGGTTPFKGLTHQDIFNSIKRGAYTFDDLSWQDITEEAKSCIRTLLNPDPLLRPSAAEALEIPFIRDGPTGRLSAAPLVHAYQSFRTFTRKIRFKQLARASVARAAAQGRRGNKPPVAGGGGGGGGGGHHHHHHHHHPAAVIPAVATVPEEENEEATSSDSGGAGAGGGGGAGASLTSAAVAGAVGGAVSSASSSSSSGEKEGSSEGESSQLLTAFVCGGLLGAAGAGQEEEVLLREFEMLSRHHRGAMMLEYQGFKRIMRKMGKDRFPLRRVFQLFDKDEDGYIEFPDLVAGFQRLQCTGDDAVEFLFDVVDEEGTGAILREELAKFLIFHRQRLLMEQAKPLLSYIDLSVPISAESVDMDPDGYELTEKLAEFFAELGGDGTGTVTREEWVANCRKVPDFIAMLMGHKRLSRRESFNSLNSLVGGGSSGGAQ